LRSAIFSCSRGVGTRTSIGWMKFRFHEG
jgi:hypothetical protein